jgi:hypothetical protein
MKRVNAAYVIATSTKVDLAKAQVWITFESA